MPLPPALSLALSTDAAQTLRAALIAAWSALDAGDREISLPRVGAQDRLLVRWLYRHRLAADPRPWWRLVQVASSADPGGARRSLARALNGWLWLDAPSPLARSALELGVTVLMPEGPVMSVPPGLLSTWGEEERLHLVATDPALREARQAARVSYRAGVLCVVGEPGSGRASLLEWTHRVEAPGVPLVHLRPDADRPAAQATQIVHDLHAWTRPELVTAALDRPGPATVDTQKERASRPRDPAFAAIIGDSDALNRAIQAALRVAPLRTPVHLRGATGTGKELFARAIHDASPRATGPYVEVNAAALSAERAEADLFGWKKGAFSGAHQDNLGFFGQAEGGTLFLDEIADLPVAIRPRLLRILESGRGVRVGETREREFDVRVITASHRALEGLLAEERADLYYRLVRHVIDLPSLADRREDIGALATHFLGRARGETGRISAEARVALERAAWPGNIRQLRSLIEGAALHMSAATTLELGHLREAGLRASPSGPALYTTTVMPAGLPGLDEARRAALQRGLVRLPTLAERSAADRGALIRGLLLDREITDEALDSLAQAVGDRRVGELAWRVAALAESADPVIDAGTLGRVHPDLFPEEASEALIVRDASGALHRFPGGALLVASRRYTQLLADDLMDPSRLGPLARLDASLGGRRPERWPFPADVPAILLLREGAQVRVLRAPEPGLVTVRGIDGAAGTLGPGQQAAFDGGLVLDGADGAPLLVAFAGPAALRALEGRVALASSTPAPTAEPDPHAPLEPDERAALVALIVGFAAGEGSNLATWIRQRWADHGEAGRRLWSRLEPERQRSQVITRLLAPKKNPGLLDALRAALADQTSARADALPMDMARMLDGDGLD